MRMEDRQRPTSCCLLLLLLLLLFASLASATTKQQSSNTTAAPNIIFILADDLGWNDVGFHGSLEVQTPNIDALAYSGVILNNYYVQPICTPSRSALMTGRHPIHTGMQHSTIGVSHPYGLPLDLTTLPQHLQRLGYVSHHVGKWHLGFYKREYTPTFRGFRSHFGYWGGRVDYYDHTAQAEGWGTDFRRNMVTANDAYGKYATELFTGEAVRLVLEHDAQQPLFLYLAHLAVHSGNSYAPLQAPADAVEKFSYINDLNRRTFAGMLSKLDDSVGEVVAALELRGMLENSIIVFTTDNGGPAAGFNLNHASNWPLRGVKDSLWEGGVRGAGFVWSPLIKQSPGTVSRTLMAIEDWLPSLYAAAGGDPDHLPEMDGVNMWPSMSTGAPSARIQLLHNIDPVSHSAGLRVGDWKLVHNPAGQWVDWNGWYGPAGRNCTVPECQLTTLLQAAKSSLAGRAALRINSQAFAGILQTREHAMVNCTIAPDGPPSLCRKSSHPCLFHIPSDPCELQDLSAEHPALLQVMMHLLQLYNSTAVPAANRPSDAAANPKYWNYTWNNWMDYPEPVGLNTN